MVEKKRSNTDKENRAESEGRPAKEAKKFDATEVAAPGFCTDQDKSLTAEEIEQILNGDVHEILVEKQLVGGKATKKLHVVKNDDLIKLVFYYDGKKCVKKDKVRIQAMMEAAKADAGEGSYGDAQAYVLLAPESGICKRNTLKELVADGYVVQRVG